MKRLFSFFIFFTFTFSGFSQTLSPAQMKVRALEILKKYDPEGYEIITEYEKAPSKYKINEATITLNKAGSFMEYIDGNTEKSILKNVNTAVHESNHGYTSRMAYSILTQQPDIKYKFGDDYYVYFINHQEKILVKLTPTFPSKELEKVIPKNLQTFRFDTYIQGTSSTQQHGIYGLLDEMNAYYIGTKTSFLLYDYFANELKTEGKGWFDYMQEVDGTLYAYMEFKFYILKYLLYAQKQKPQIYQGIMANSEFKKAFLKIDQNFAKLATDYFEVRDKILSDLKEQGHQVELGADFTYIDRSGTGNFMDVYHLLENELSKKEYVAMMEGLKK
jgi:hypothetical protein